MLSYLCGRKNSFVLFSDSYIRNRISGASLAQCLKCKRYITVNDDYHQFYQKKLELASEVAKQQPDVAAAAVLQQGISDLLAQLAQRHLEHFFRVQKIIPDVGRGGPMGFGMMGHQMMHPDMMGPGMMHRSMMGPGGYGGGDCPGSGFRGAYGMGPGMMRSGGNRDMMNRDDSRQYHDTQIVAPAEKKAGASEEN